MVLFDQLLIFPANLPLAGQGRAIAPDPARRREAPGWRVVGARGWWAPGRPRGCRAGAAIAALIHRTEQCPQDCCQPGRLMLGKLSQRVPALTVAFPRGI